MPNCSFPRETWVECPDGRRLGHIVRPLESMGAYIPAGRYPLPSTLLMTVIPAQVAGVRNICVASPRPSAEILAVARFLGIENVFRMGGAQAIAALAFGTATVPKVDRIVGPGNIYVAAAKKLLAGEVGIDFVAGPTEIVIIADDGDPRYIAADMLAQAEHDVEASAILLTTSRTLAERVAVEVIAPTRITANCRGGLRGDSQQQRRHLVPVPRRGRGSFQPARARASGDLRRQSAAKDSARGQRLHWAEQSGSRGRLRLRTESCASHFRRGADSRRAFRLPIL